MICVHTGVFLYRCVMFMDLLLSVPQFHVASLHCFLMLRA